MTSLYISVYLRCPQARAATTLAVGLVACCGFLLGLHSRLERNIMLSSALRR